MFGEQPLDVQRALTDPKLQATVPDLEFAHTVLLIDCDPIDEAPVWDLRIRKGIRRHGTKLIVASARPTALDPSAVAALRFAPGSGEAFLVALDAALSGDEGNLGGAASAAGSNGTAIREFADALRAAGEEIVIVYGERALRGQAGRALLNIAARLNLGGIAGAGLLELPLTPNGRGVREAGFAPGHGPGYAAPDAPGHDALGIAEGLASGDLHTIWLHNADPLRTHPNRRLWDEALGTAQTVIAVDSVLTDSIREHADVVFPAEAYPEKEGTLVHPDGRVQRLPPGDRPRSRTSGCPWLRRASAVAGHLRRLECARPQRGRVPDRRAGVGRAVRRRAVLRRPHARRDRRPRRALAGAPRVRLARLGARQARDPRRRTGRRRTGRFASAPGARCGRRGRRRLADPALRPRAPTAELLARRRRGAGHPRRRSRARGARTERLCRPAPSCARRSPGTVFLAEATEENPANVLAAGLVTIERAS